MVCYAKLTDESTNKIIKFNMICSNYLKLRYSLQPQCAVIFIKIECSCEVGKETIYGIYFLKNKVSKCN